MFINANLRGKWQNPCPQTSSGKKWALGRESMISIFQQELQGDWSLLEVKESNQCYTNFFPLSTSHEIPWNDATNTVYRKHITVIRETFIKVNKYCLQERNCFDMRNFFPPGNSGVMFSVWIETDLWTQDLQQCWEQQEAPRQIEACRWGFDGAQSPCGSQIGGASDIIADALRGCLSLSLTSLLFAERYLSLYWREPWNWKDAPGQTPPRPTLLPTAELS